MRNNCSILIKIYINLSLDSLPFLLRENAKGICCLENNFSVSQDSYARNLPLYFSKIENNAHFVFVKEE